jgi:hypothetical protein
MKRAVEKRIVLSTLLAIVQTSPQLVGFGSEKTRHSNPIEAHLAPGGETPFRPPSSSMVAKQEVEAAPRRKSGSVQEGSPSFFFLLEITLLRFLGRSFKSIHIALRLWP